VVTRGAGRPARLPARRVRDVRIQERDPAHGHRPYRTAAADRSRQGGGPLPGQARRGRLSRRVRV